MEDPGPAERARRNATSIAGTIVTGVWLTAMMAGYEHWLALMLFGYIVVLPVVGMVFGDDEEWSETNEDSTAESTVTTDDSTATDDSATNDRALAKLRERYADGELTDEQFERKVERLLETDTLENAEDRRRDRERDRARERDRERELE